jgi:hypothetical protein
MPFQFRKEAIEEDLNSNFPSQGQGNPPLYYSLSEVVVPTYSINNVAEGSSLPTFLQTSWDFSTGFASLTNTSSTIISNTGFWKIDLNCSISAASTPAGNCRIYINSGITTKTIWQKSNLGGAINDLPSTTQETFVVFLRSGDSLVAVSGIGGSVLDVWYRQLADLNGNLVNPLGYSAA